MSTALLSRLYYLSCELRPDLPPGKLLGLLGKSWAPLIAAGAEYGLGGTTVAIPSASMDQLSQLYMAGAESGASPDLEEFRAALASQIYGKICGNDELSVLQQINLSTDLGSWLKGRDSTNGDGEIDWDAKVDVPPFTKTGWYPIDRIHGDHGVPQEVITVLSKPGVGKTTAAIAIAAAWRKQNIGPVTMIQTEIAPSALRMKIDGIPNSAGLWRSGIDKLVFGRRGASTALQHLIDNPDPTRLVLFDSVTGFCGQGDTSESRQRFADLYDELCQVKNLNRMVMTFSHVKRGTDMADIESAAGSSSIERFSGSLVYMHSDGVARPDGKVEVHIESLKNRYGRIVRPFKFIFDYVTGEATDPNDELMSEELV